MDSCLLCLEINKDVLDCIKANSTQWQELEITKAIEKHFWALSTIQQSAWICSSCWRQVDGFHKFYLRIEEAHVNFGKIKLEDLEVPVECKDEFTQKFIITDITDELDNDNGSLCFKNLEMPIDQDLQGDLAETEILVNRPLQQNLVTNTESAVIMEVNELNLHNMPRRDICKRLESKSYIYNQDPLEKCKKIKKKRIYKAKIYREEKSSEEKKIEDSKVKEEPLDTISDHDNEVAEVKNRKVKNSTETKRRKVYRKQPTNRKENDKFIAEHFKKMFCNLCQFPFEDFPAMQKHFTETHSQRGYVVCCKRKFFYRTRLVDHLHYHLNPDHFKCNECGKTLANRIKLHHHMVRAHSAEGLVKQHFCDICGKSFRESYVLRTHKLTHLPEDEKKFPCSDCGKKYGSPYVLNQHRQAVHLKRFAKICYICGKSINSSAEFTVHMNRHEGIPLINCDVCGLRLTSERGLKRHKESQHPVGGKQDHQCPICPKVSPTLKALRKHISTMHEKGYDHKCSICEKAFKRSEALREHMATHTGTTLYTCPWCPKTFNSNGNMHAHRKKIHPKEWEESKLQKYSSNIRPEI